jgi:lysophospholipase L1-like esterase
MGIGGYGAGGYRGPLGELLGGLGRGAVLVGPEVDDSGRHAGYAGRAVSDVRLDLERILAESRPDVLLLLAGTNDLRGDRAQPDDVAAALHELVRAALTAAPRARVLVGTLPPMQGHPGADRVAATNVRLRQRIEGDGSLAGRVAVADLFAALRADDLPDGLHCDESGYRRMAEVWFAALQRLLVAAPGEGPR